MVIPYRIELFGGLCVHIGDRKVTRFRTRKTTELLAYLACFPRSHPREILIELLWPECDVDAGRHSLNTALSSLRLQLEPPGVVSDGSVLVGDRHCIGLQTSAINTDVREFESALKEAAVAVDPAERIPHLVRALELYTGALLPGYYSDWVFPEQERLEETYFQGLGHLIALCEEAGDLDQALHHALRAVSLHRTREEAHHEVIRLQSLTGKPDAAIRHYRDFEQMLARELDTRPRRKTLELIRAIQEDADHPVSAGIATDAGESAFRARESSQPIPLEPVGGAMPLASRFYIVRSTDHEFDEAVLRGDSIVLVKGPRQVGKTSLLARSLQLAREAGRRVALTNFQVFNGSHLESVERFLPALADSLAEQLDLSLTPDEVWDTRRGPSPSFRRFIRREVLDKLSEPLVWGLDEVDRLFTCPFGSEVFGLFRSWHDARALEPDGSWSLLTLAISYSTEPHLFITDLNQSPFNVGTRLFLEDFTREQVAELNMRYGALLRDDSDLDRLLGLVGGQPYLVRRALHEMAGHGVDLKTLEARARHHDWIFGEHLRRLSTLVVRDSELVRAVREVLDGRSCTDRAIAYRLESAGVLRGGGGQESEFRCPLYADYFRNALQSDE
jgi:DNA-binding SARP family transcriptional activator